MYVHDNVVPWQEKEELMRRLQAQEENLTREQRRQLELSRLKREQRKAQKEEKFDAAAILLGMASQQVKFPLFWHH